jgi:hypothetical protein
VPVCEEEDHGQKNKDAKGKDSRAKPPESKSQGRDEKYNGQGTYQKNRD